MMRVNITISLFSPRNIPRNLPSASKPTATEQVAAPSMSTFPDGDVSTTLLKDSYKPDYQLMTIVAQLDAVTFDISPSTPPPQTPYQRIVSFQWNIVPKESGPQSLAVGIAGQWQPKGEGELETVYFLLSQFSVNVDASAVPFLTFGQLTFSEILFALLGSILNVPLIVGYVGKWRKERERKQKIALRESSTLTKSRKRKRRH